MAAKYVFSGGIDPWPYSPYLTYGPLSKTVYVGDVVDDIPSTDVRFLIDAGFIMAEADWKALSSKPSTPATADTTSESDTSAK
ncbi:hypothetical protein UFOVP238_48 [uncultured Caudovirales phage]|uniref:Uncharacterized protein n=1 Tax=uncultured Caudovirales phage TaxID=2100421 RepID=A0A6J7WUA7_9CAUD|nr:hypothetical protein UFOVP238_48 [uncultured Caudovirales phage]